MTSVLVGCVKELEDVTVSSEYISFSPFLAGETKSAGSVQSSAGIMGIETEEWMFEQPQTKASPMLLLSGDANVTWFAFSRFGQKL